MDIFSNRDVFVLGYVKAGGLKVEAMWLKDAALVDTDQELWHEKERHGVVHIPANTDCIHTDTFLPYAPAALEDRTKGTCY